MTRKDFLLKAAEWFFFDNVEESLRIISEAESDDRHIENVYYKAVWQDEPAGRLFQMVHDLAVEFYNMYEKGKKDKATFTLEETLNLLKEKKNEREETSID